MQIQLLKTCYLIILLGLLTVNLLAQKEATIAGRIFEKEAAAPLSYATIAPNDYPQILTYYMPSLRDSEKGLIVAYYQYAVPKGT